MSPLFLKIKEAALGKSYDLSFAYLTPAKMRAIMVYKKPRRLQSKVGVPTEASGYKHTNHVSNVLSFPLSKTSGEILICKSAAKPFTHEFLFIHGCLHLKGLQHGATMESAESKLLKKFGLAKFQHANNHGHRRRNLPRQGGHKRAV